MITPATTLNSTASSGRWLLTTTINTVAISPCNYLPYIHNQLLPYLKQLETDLT